MANIHDLIFIGEQWEFFEVPKDKKWMFKYFDTPIQEDYLKYYLLFGNAKNFNNHTGVRCRKHWLAKIEKKRAFLENLHKEAKKSKDMSALAFIESGQYKIVINDDF